ncbi:Heat stress transcription factor B-2a [Galdieria sulphuraria]|nr:Heat stress transcription factor B-2a [Galdieria sulphuraria]
MDPEISKTAALSYSVEDKNADLWKQGTHSESRPIISMVSSDSLKTAGNQQVKLEVNEERFAAISSPFLRKLLSIVEEKDIEHLCCWTKSGRSFVVWHPIRFENEVLPRYYKHSNFSSFVRQLNQYGFHKLHPEAWEFGHPLFVRNRIDLIVRICRRPSRRLKKQTDAHQVDSLVEEVTNHNLSQCEENGKALSNAISSAMSINDNEETILEAMESLDNVQWSQEEEEEEEEDDDDDDNDNNNNNYNNREESNSLENKNLSDETCQLSSMNKSPVNTAKEKPAEIKQSQDDEVDVQCVFGLLENIYGRLNMIQHEVSQMRSKIDSFQDILQTLCLHSKTESREDEPDSR